MTSIFRASIALAGLVCSTGALAQLSDFYRPVLPPNVSEGGIAGLAVIAGRAYQGADESRTRVLPGLDYQWANGFFAGVGNGVGYNASRRPDMAYGARLTVDFGRDEQRSAALRGLGDIGTRPEVGVFFNLSPMQGLTLASSLRAGSGKDRDGVVVDLGLQWSTQWRPQWRLGASVATTWANQAYQQDYFGVTPGQSLNSVYAAYRPDAGLRDVRVSASAAYRLTPDWQVIASLTRTELQGDARRSPLVQQDGATTGVLVVGYRF